MSTWEIPKVTHLHKMFNSNLTLYQEVSKKSYSLTYHFTLRIRKIKISKLYTHFRPNITYLTCYLPFIYALLIWVSNQVENIMTVCRSILLIDKNKSNKLILFTKTLIDKNKSNKLILLTKTKINNMFVWFYASFYTVPLVLHLQSTWSLNVKI